MKTHPRIGQPGESVPHSDTDSFYRRHLPHWQPPGGTIFLTWRLYDSLPQEAIDGLADEQQHLNNQPGWRDESPHDRAVRHSKRLFALADRTLHRTETGPRWLQDERIAQLVVNALFHYHLRWYVLVASVVMPNHVHVVLTPLPEDGQAGKPVPRYVPLRKITQSIKGFTAREANRMLKRTGLPFWQDESYDRWARDEAELQRVVDYVQSDPVRAGLVEHGQEWQWSAALAGESGRIVGEVTI